MEGERRDLLEALEDAWEEWQAAQNFFSEAADPDLVDQAIFRLEAAERRYDYLWKLFRQKYKGE